MRFQMSGLLALVCTLPLPAQGTVAGGVLKIDGGALSGTFSSATTPIPATRAGSADRSIDFLLDNETERVVTGLSFDLRPAEGHSGTLPRFGWITIGEARHHGGESWRTRAHVAASIGDSRVPLSVHLEWRGTPPDARCPLWELHVALTTEAHEPRDEDPDAAEEADQGKARPARGDAPRHPLDIWETAHFAPTRGRYEKTHTFIGSEGVSLRVHHAETPKPFAQPIATLKGRVVFPHGSALALRTVELIDPRTKTPCPDLELTRDGLSFEIRGFPPLAPGDTALLELHFSKPVPSHGVTTISLARGS